MKNVIAWAILASSVALPGFVTAARADAVSDAKAFVEATSKPNAPWDGPTTGPKAAAGKTIVYVSTDQKQRRRARRRRGRQGSRRARSAGPSG